MRKKIFIILGILVFIIGAASMVIISRVRRFESYMDQIEISDVNLAEINDGLYTGTVDTGVIKVVVEVLIEDHQFTNIKLLQHRNGQGEGAEVIIDDIIKKQKLTVDTISGATLSSRVIQDAIQRAVMKGKKS